MSEASSVRRVVDELFALKGAIEATIRDIQNTCSHKDLEFIRSTRNEDYEGTTFTETWVCQRCAKVIVK